MGDNVQEFLNSLISQYGIIKVLLAPFAVIGLLVGTGLFAGGAVSVLAVSLSGFVAVVIISTLSLQLKKTHELLAARARVLNLYIDRFAQRPGAYAYTIEQWHESVIVTRGGDTRADKWVVARVGGEHLLSLWSSISQSGQVSDSQRRRVKIEARSFDDHGVPGARYDVTQTWEGNNVFACVHFGQPVLAGSVVRVWLHWEWPEYYKNLLNGDTETIEWAMSRPCERLYSEIRFDKTCKLENGFRVTEFQNCPVPRQSEDAAKATILTTEYENLQPGNKVGFKLDGRVIRQ